MIFSHEAQGSGFISGMITNAEGDPVPFATVALPDGHGAMCDSEGTFTIGTGSLSFPVTLLVSAINYESKEFIINSEEEMISISLDEKSYKLEDIEVVSRKSLEARSNVSTITLTKTTIEEQMPIHAGELLGKRAGFSAKSGYQVPIVLRGLSGKRLLVLRNGNRRFSSYPAGFMSHTINVYELERIEVEKGAASVIYGAGAIAGIVNLIDKSPFEKRGLTGKVISGFSTNNNERSILTSLGWSGNKLAVQGSFRYRKADDFKYPDGTIAENSFYEDKDLSLKTGYKANENHQFNFSADIHLGDPWGKPKGFSGTDYMLATTNIENSTNLLLNHTFNNSGVFQKSDLSIYYSKDRRELEKRFFTAATYELSFQEITNYSDYYYGAKWLGKLKLSEPLYLQTGAEFYSFHFSSPTESNDYIQNLSFRNRISIDARSYVYGIFTEASLDLSEKVKMTAGIRFDVDDVFEGEVFDLDQEEENETHVSALSGTLAVRVHLSESSTLKVNLARSFRMPETTELFADSYTSRGILYGNTDLKPEYCNSLDFNLDTKLEGLEIELSPFVWIMEDMISKEELHGQPGTNFQYINIGKTRLWGGELTLTAPFRSVALDEDELSFTAACSYLNGTDVTDSENVFSSGDALDYIPPFNLKSKLSYHSPRSKDIVVNAMLDATYYAYQSRQPEEGAYATPAYTVVGCSLGVTANHWKSRPSLRVVASNLLNEEYQTYQSYLLAEGRTIRFFLTLNLN